jgi:hypothetical protein
MVLWSIACTSLPLAFVSSLPKLPSPLPGPRGQTVKHSSPCCAQCGRWGYYPDCCRWGRDTPARHRSRCNSGILFSVLSRIVTSTSCGLLSSADMAEIPWQYCPRSVYREGLKSALIVGGSKTAKHNNPSRVAWDTARPDGVVLAVTSIWLSDPQCSSGAEPLPVLQSRDRVMRSWAET